LKFLQMKNWQDDQLPHLCRGCVLKSSQSAALRRPVQNLRVPFQFDEPIGKGATADAQSGNRGVQIRVQPSGENAHFAQACSPMEVGESDIEETTRRQPFLPERREPISALVASELPTEGASFA
jgi:hypothetical protein